MGWFRDQKGANEKIILECSNDYTYLFWILANSLTAHFKRHSKPQISDDLYTKVMIYENYNLHIFWSTRALSLYNNAHIHSCINVPS